MKDVRHDRIKADGPDVIDEKAQYKISKPKGSITTKFIEKKSQEPNNSITEESTSKK